MPLDASTMIQNGHARHTDVLQFVQLLTGVMTDQPVTVANTITVGAAPMTLGAVANRPFIAPALSGALSLGTASNVRWNVDVSGPLLAQLDNQYDIGASGANRPRTIYAGTSMNAPAFVAATFTASVSVNSPLYTIANGGNTLTTFTQPTYSILYLQNANGTSSGNQGYLDLLATEAVEMYFNYNRTATTGNPVDATKPWGRLIVSAAYGGGGMFFEVAAAGGTSMVGKMSVNPAGNMALAGQLQLNGARGANQGSVQHLASLPSNDVSVFAEGGNLYGWFTNTSGQLVLQGGGGSGWIGASMGTLYSHGAVVADSYMQTPTYFVGPSQTQYIQDAGGGIIRYLCAAAGRHNFENGAGGYGDIWGRWLSLSDGANAVVQSMTGSMYVRASSGSVIMDSGSLSVSTTVSCTTLSASGNVWVNGGILYFSSGASYMQWNGARIAFTHGIDIMGVTLSQETARGYGALMTASGQGDFVLGGGTSILYLHPNLTVGIQQNAPYMDIFGYAYVRATGGGFVAQSSYYYMNTALSIAMYSDGTYIRPTHSLGFNTTGNQVVWPNGSYISGNSGYVQGSNRKLKLAIESVEDDALLAVVRDPRLGVNTFEWPDDPRRNIGFMADDVATVLPEYAFYDEDEPSGYSAQEMTVMLWGAVRALSKKIEVLEGKA